MNTFKTPKGTELPIMNIKGKPYLQCAQRIVWMREEHPDWTISTDIIERTKDSCLVKASIYDATGKLVATGHKYEDARGFPDFIEKSETSAIGRALALCGYGTQFTTDLDEGERLADSPVAPTGPSKLAELKPITETIRPLNNFVGDDPGDYTPAFGKFKGKQLKTIPLKELSGYVEWIHTSAAKDNKPMSHAAIEFTKMVEHFFDSAKTMQKQIKAKADSSHEPPDFGPPPQDDTDNIPF